MSELKNIITLAEDYGEAIIIDNIIFERQELTIDDYSYSGKEGDIFNISGILFQYDDNNIVSGNVHREWSPTEIALASLPENTSKVWEHPNTGMETLTFELLDKDLTYVVNHSGVARIMGISLSTTPSIYTVYVNNLARAKFQTNVNASMNTSVTVLVQKGDVIKIPDVYSRVIVLPFEYPYVD
jgi:hypothetical protein